MILNVVATQFHILYVPKYTLRNYLKIVGRSRGFTDETIETEEWLLRNRDLFREFSTKSLNDTKTVREFVKRVGTEDNMNSLWLFMHVDDGRKANEADRHLWDNARELREKAQLEFNDIPETTPNALRGFEEEHVKIHDDLGPDFKTSRYKGLAPQLVPILSKVYETKSPIIKTTRAENSQRPIITIACPDYTGLIAGIAGRLYEKDHNLRQLHAFTLAEHKLALDFLDIELSGKDKDTTELVKDLRETILERTMIEIPPQDILKSLPNKKYDLVEGDTYHRLSFYTPSDCPGIVYALTRALFDETTAHANICGLNAVVEKGNVENHLFFSLRPDLEGRRMEFGELQTRLKPYFV